MLLFSTLDTYLFFYASFTIFAPTHSIRMVQFQWQHFFFDGSDVFMNCLAQTSSCLHLKMDGWMEVTYKSFYLVVLFWASLDDVYVLSLWHLSQGMAWTFSRVHLNFSVVQIDKMFTNPCRLYTLASVCVCTQLLVHVGCNGGRNFQGVTGVWLFGSDIERCSI